MLVRGSCGTGDGTRGIQAPIQASAVSFNRAFVFHVFLDEDEILGPEQPHTNGQSLGVTVFRDLIFVLPTTSHVDPSIWSMGPNVARAVNERRFM